MLEGILRIDKPRAMTSHDAVEFVRRTTGIRTVGHTGTLDPDANGLLLMCLGRATKFAKVFEGLEKTYWVVLQLGSCTDTQDAAGKVVRVRSVPASLTQRGVESVLKTFRGHLRQRPPMFSAIKQQGRRLYRLARDGVTVDRPLRDIYVSRLQLLELRQGNVTLAVTCSKGTYVRTLGEEIGMALGCGAHVTHLQRCRVGPFGLAGSFPLSAARNRPLGTNLNSCLLPTTDAVAFLPPLYVTEQQRDALRSQGGAVVSDILRQTCPEGLTRPHYRLCTSPNNTVAVIQRRTSNPAKWKLLIP